MKIIRPYIRRNAFEKQHLTRFLALFFYLNFNKIRVEKSAPANVNFMDSLSIRDRSFDRRRKAITFPIFLIYIFIFIHP